MVALSDDGFAQVVARANLAPSVHNTQPTRWRYEDGAIILSLDKSRLLSVGDPRGRDAWLSCGAALEGTRLALSEVGHGVRAVETETDAVRLVLSSKYTVAPQASAVSQRSTWRGGFLEASAPARSALAALCDHHDDATCVSDHGDLGTLANLNDDVSLQFFRAKPYRDELTSWMRLSRRHAKWDQDGLNAQALCMSRIESFGAGIVLKSPVFEILDKLSLSSALVSERSKTMTATGVVLFHRPMEEAPIDSGVAFYRLWLALTEIGLAAWPMAATADEPGASAAVSKQFGIPQDHRLINLLRVGVPPHAEAAGRARLPLATLVA